MIVHYRFLWEGLHDLKQVVSLAEVDKPLVSNITKRNIMEVGIH